MKRDNDLLQSSEPRESGGEMSPRREVVTLAGHLSGISQEVDCSVTAVKLWLCGSDSFEYSLVIPFDTPSDLPEGVYKLSFDGRAMPVQRHDEAGLAVRT